MSFKKSLLKALKEETSLKKGEDPEAYKKIASTGFLLAHPVKIKGESHRKDNGIPYHTSIKFFDKENGSPEEAHKIASQLETHPPHPKEVGIEPKVLKDRNGNDVYAIGLHGKHADKLKEHHDKFSHMGHKENYKWGAHISVPKAVHDEIKASGAKTAHDAGIEFGHVELKRGPKVLNTYKPKKLVEAEGLIETLNKKEVDGLKIPVILDLKKGKKDISEKTLSEIQKETAWTWAARAAASYEELAKTGDWKWKTDAEEYRHEAVEHAALIGDTHPYVLEEIHKVLEKYRNISEDKKQDMKKSEDSEEISTLPEDEDSHALLNRQEDKYFLPKKYIEKVIEALGDRLALGDIDTDTRYNTNRTIYLDDKDLNTFHDCMIKKKPRLKVRIRQYSPNSLGWEEVAYAEFKMKEEDGFTKKIRVRIPSKDIESLSNGGKIILDESLVNINKDIDRRSLEARVRAINSTLSRRGLKKQIEVRYERRAYTGNNLRITIDENLRYLNATKIDENVKNALENEKEWKEFSEPYILAAWENPFILEVKTDKGIPSWLKSLLKDVNAKETSFSKYCAGLLTQIKTGKDSGEILGEVGYLGSIEPFGKSEEFEAPPLTKPYSSEAQRRWAHTAAGKKALGGKAGVHEWDEATKGKKLSEKVDKIESLEKGEKTVDIAVVVLKDGNFILVGKRRKNKKWGLPGGRCEGKNEDYKETALRELEEETGLKIEIDSLSLAGVREIKAGGEKKRVHVYTAPYPGGEPTTKKDPDEEFIKWSWIRCEEGLLPDEILDGEMTPPAEAAFDELEMVKNEELKKGALKNAAVGLGMAGALASASPSAQAPVKNTQPYSRDKISRTIAQVESSGGKNLNHKPTSTGTAYGAHALMPNTIKETIKLNPDLKHQYSKALHLHDKDLHRYMQDNPKLENEIVDRHLARLEHHFGQNPMAIASAWNQGISGTNKMLSQKQDLGTHPYVQKFKQAYKEGK